MHELIRIIWSVQYDVTEGKSFYGPDGGYHMFAGHDCTRCLGTMDLKPSALDDLGYSPENEKQAKVLSDWVAKMATKYRGNCVFDHLHEKLMSCNNLILILKVNPPDISYSGRKARL